MSTTSTWQSTLATEHEAVYAYGLIGGRLGPSSQLARFGLDEHRLRRDRCVAELRAQHATPVAAAPAYLPPQPLTSDARADLLATHIEQACSAAYLALVALPEAPTRRLAMQWLRVSAIQQSLWSGQIPALPGFGVDD